MAKFLNRLAARLGREQLRESAKEGKNWIVTKRLVLEAEDAEGNAFDAEFDKGSEVEILEEAGDWFLVRNFAGVEGWIKKENIPEVKKFW